MFLASKGAYASRIETSLLLPTRFRQLLQGRPDEEPAPARMRGLATGSPVKLTFYRAVETENASGLEKYIHQLLDAKRAENGEFFHVNRQELDNAINEAEAFIRESQPLLLEAKKLCRKKPNDTMVDPTDEMRDIYLQLRKANRDKFLLERRIELLEYFHGRFPFDFARDDKGKGGAFIRVWRRQGSTAGPSTTLRSGQALHFAQGCDFLSFLAACGRKAPKSILPTSIAGVPSATFGTGSSTPRHKTICYVIDLRGASLKMKPFLEGTEKHLVGCKKREKIEKVTGSQGRLSKLATALALLSWPPAGLPRR